MMMTVEAPFRELKGIGPATEGKLHATGIHTWAALAETLDAIAHVTGIDAKRLRNLRDESRKRDDEALAVAGGTGERAARFVLGIVAGADGLVARTNVTDVRSGFTRSFPGLAGTEIVEFVNERIGEPVSSEMTASEADHESEMPDAYTEFDPAEPIHFEASSARNDLVVIAAGKAIGGANERIALRWDTSDISADESGGFKYRASLASRSYGAASSPAWRPLGVSAGGASPGEIVELEFDATDLAAGINRLELTVEVQPLPDAAEAVRRVGARMATAS